LFNFFMSASIGKVVDIKVIRDPRTGRSKGAAYVEFESQESVMLAVAMSGQQVMGKFISRFYLVYLVKL
jgi:RNA-binding protein 39